MTTTKTRFQDIDVDNIDPDPDNRNAVADADFVKSITSAGIIEPIVVITHPHKPNRFMLVAGERRWRGAKKAGLSTIPTVVRDDLDDKARIELAVIENLQRDDVPAGQEAMQLLRLVTVGHTTKTLATAVGRNQKWVAQRLKLAELPTKARKRLDDGHWTVAAALEAVALLDHPDMLDEILAADAETSQRLIGAGVNKISFAKQATKLINAARKDGHTLHEDDTVRLTSFHELGVTVEDHQGQSCHRVVLTGQPQFGRPGLQHGCIDPKAHRTSGSSDLKIGAKASGNPRSEADKARQRDKLAARAARLEAMTAAAATKIPKPKVQDLVFDEILQLAGLELAKKAAKVLSLEVPKDANATEILRHAAAKSPAAKQQVALAIAMVSRDQSIEHNWGHATRAKTWITWLKTTVGFTPSAFDKNQLKRG